MAWLFKKHEILKCFVVVIICVQCTHPELSVLKHYHIAEQVRVRLRGHSQQLFVQVSMIIKDFEKQANLLAQIIN